MWSSSDSSMNIIASRRHAKSQFHDKHLQAAISSLDTVSRSPLDCHCKSQNLTFSFWARRRQSDWAYIYLPCFNVAYDSIGESLTTASKAVLLDRSTAMFRASVSSQCKNLQDTSKLSRYLAIKSMRPPTNEPTEAPIRNRWTNTTSSL
jgi:hypothetical protein